MGAHTLFAYDFLQIRDRDRISSQQAQTPKAESVSTGGQPFSVGMRFHKHGGGLQGAFSLWSRWNE